MESNTLRDGSKKGKKETGEYPTVRYPLNKRA